MTLVAIAYPVLSDSDFEIIQSFRKDHDTLYYNIVKPHFTFVFPLIGLSASEFSDEIKKQIKGFPAIDFSLRCAILHKDAFQDLHHVFLVPDEGFSLMVKLHDALYSNALKVHHRLDIDYIPHIGVGNSKDIKLCKKMVDEWNAREFNIKGKIVEIDIVSYDTKEVVTLEKITLS